MLERKNLIYVVHTCVGKLPLFTRHVQRWQRTARPVRGISRMRNVEKVDPLRTSRSLNVPGRGEREGKKKENICSCAPRLFHAAEIYKAERNNAELNRSLQETSGIVLEGDIRRPTSTTRSRNIFFVRAFSQSTGYLFIFRYRSPSIDYMEIFIVTQILRARQYEKVLLYEGFMNMMRLTQMY